MMPSVVCLLRCPATRQPLSLATQGEVARLNAAIAAGQCRNASGRIVTEPIEKMLIAADRRYAYLVRDGIPILLPEEAVSGASL